MNNETEKRAKRKTSDGNPLIYKAKTDSTGYRVAVSFKCL